MAIDPVCKVEVNEIIAEYVSEYKGKKYYFSSQVCQAEFDKDPDEYAD